jgi:hypothetical protein
MPRRNAKERHCEGGTPEAIQDILSGERHPLFIPEREIFSAGTWYLNKIQKQ